MAKRKPNPHALPIEKRKRLSKPQRARLFLDRAGRCHRCSDKIAAGVRWIVEHYVSLECGGSNVWSNLCLTCTACFHPKNREDRKKASKGRRLRQKEAEHDARMAGKLIPVTVWGEKADGPSTRRPEKRAWPSRPFPGSRKDRQRRAQRAR